MAASYTARQGADNVLLRIMREVDPTFYLFGAALLAVVVSNTGLAPYYFAFLNLPINFSVGDLAFTFNGEPLTIGSLINDGLMMVFFFQVGLEIKHEIIDGALANFRSALLPVLAACGGMLTPILIFTLVDHDPVHLRGAAIPMSTDLAFSLAVLATLNAKRIPVTLKVFLMSFAVVDDMGGILTIALFYSQGVHFPPLLIALGIIAFGWLMGRRGVFRSWFYYVLLFCVWICMMDSGIASTIGGVMVAFIIPYRPVGKRKYLLRDYEVVREAIKTVVEAGKSGQTFLSDDTINRLMGTRDELDRAFSPVQSIIRQVTPFTNYLVLPLFAFANAGVNLDSMSLSEITGIPLAVFLGLFIGKPLGIFSFTWFFARIRLVKFPPGMTNLNLLATACFGGIGFTVPLFIARMAYGPLGGTLADTLMNQAKIGLFGGCIFSATLACMMMGIVGRWEWRHGKGVASAEYKEYLDRTTLK
ncbi:MAG: Na+/H+ antiporter NhaA [Bacteroidales bacterium]|nr:Na+/H+ antiporter NhaA [Bacteroidales bacterium]